MSGFPDDDDLGLHAYLDGELDAEAARGFEHRLAGDDALRARYEQMLALRQALCGIPQAEMPERLRQRVIAASKDTPRERRWSLSWRAMAAAVIIGLLVSGTSMLVFDQYRSRQEIVSQVIAGHVRGLLASKPFDFASSDSRVVQPWFTARIARAPQVVNLAEQGFALSGGRIDVVGDTPVPTVVYQHDAHVVSLTMLPPGMSLPQQALSGYHAVSWSDGNATYVAVCDLPFEDLDNFRRIYTAATP